MVKLHCKSFAEKFLIPAFVYFFKMLYPFHWVNNPRRKIAAAAGGCMLVRYDALKKVGGLEAIRGALIDDCALAKLMKQLGPIWLGLTQDVRSVRTYPTIDDIRAMVARTAYDQLSYSPLKLFMAMMAMMIAFIAPMVLTFSGEFGGVFFGLSSWLFMSVTFYPIAKFYGRWPVVCIFLPLIAVFYMAFTLDSAYSYYSGKGGTWKGRTQAGP
jgi:hopene-associated glycosyltransferase HpnB